MNPTESTRPAEAWFAQQGWTPLPFQQAAWSAYLRGRDGLVASATGSGKTHAVALGPMLERRAEGVRGDEPNAADPIQMIWITPLRALAADTARALQRAVDALGIPWSVELRTGDTSSSVKARQRERLPSVLVTTPESLALLLTWKKAETQFSSLRAVVCDEWHELMGSKRGAMLELSLARLQTLVPSARRWGLSATIGNIETAARVLVGADRPPPEIIRDGEPKTIQVETLLPESIERYPWAGHLGTRLLPAVSAQVQAANSTLIFTNTRAQTETWYRELIRSNHDLIGQVALHHGSLEQALRHRVEHMLAGGQLKAVVCTSSLDLGVDFTPVDQVIQIGSPKGVARMIQRAGRSGHQPGAISRIYCVPTNAFELVEFAAVRDLIESGEIESRQPLEKPLDILVQHLVSASLSGTGFRESELLREVRRSWTFRELTTEEWDWALQFVQRGGQALTAYPDFSRVRQKGDRFAVATPEIAKRHRMNMGTILANDAVQVCFANGKVLGTIEESFIARLRAGDRFVFAGRVLEFTRLRQMKAFVRRSKNRRGVIPRWNGGRMPLSTHLAHGVLARLADPQPRRDPAVEMAALAPILQRQAEDSIVPDLQTLLIEQTQIRDRHFLFCYPFAGRLANEGIAAVVALRLSRRHPCSVVFVVNDYGLKLSGDEAFPETEAQWRELLAPEHLLEDLIEACNASEFSRRSFRSIARVAGLIQQGYPGSPSARKHLQASSEMFYDVFQEYDPDNLLLAQADREVLEQQLEFRRIAEAFSRMQDCRLVLQPTDRVSPLSFPLYAESIRAGTVSSEQWADRVRKLSRASEAAG